MDILHLIRRDHDELLARLSALEEILDWQRGFLQRPLVKQLARELVAALQVHARSEELSLYKTLVADGGAELATLARQLTAEHGGLDEAGHRLLEILENPDTVREDVVADVIVLRDLLLEHAHREEDELLFPEVRKCFDSEARARLGEQMTSLRLALAKAPEELRGTPFPIEVRA